jgi:hypothetical protein
MARFGSHDMLSIELMLTGLAEWRRANWAAWVEQRCRWTEGLFEFLAYPPNG